MTAAARHALVPVLSPPARLAACAAALARRGGVRAWWHGCACLLLAALTSCSGSGSEVQLSLVHSDLEFPRTSDLHLTAVMATAAGGPGWIDVRGFLPLPDHCDVVRARAEETDAGLTLRIKVRDDQGHTSPCGTSVGEVAFGVYDARIRPVRPGTHQLRVVYDYGEGRERSANWDNSLFAERTALDARVVVN